MDKIHILIADDMEAHRRRLERIIQTVDNFALVGSVESGREAVRQALDKKPDIILMDIEMEDPMAGITAALEIHENNSLIKIIILTVHQADDFVFAAFQSGIVDYLIKSAPEEEIKEAIFLAISNSSPIRPVIAGKIRQEFARIKQTENNLSHVFKIVATLSPAELEILKLLSEGKNRREISEIRSVEIDTVKKQINSILKKFNKRRTKDIIRMMNNLEVFDTINNILKG